MQRDDVLTFVAPDTGIRTSALPLDFSVLITDAIESPATFLLTLFVTRTIRHGRNVIMVGLGDTLDHYTAICKKGGVQLQNEQKTGRFTFIDGVMTPVPLQHLCDKIQLKLESAEPGTVLVIDDVTNLLWSGNDVQQVVKVVGCLRALVAKHEASLIMLMHGDDISSNSDTPESFLFRRCLQFSDLWLRTTVLSSQTRGELSIHRGPALVQDLGIVDRSGSTALQYKLDETGPTFSIKGLGRMW
ncbi:hypothetical protein OIO90_001819 [Microbotryomycetes sp. JL221]|nr:hypothetical protein OIO90_001819 [Microbotryomycetes sp. JL221]